jgi:hypothetical protein
MEPPHVTAFWALYMKISEKIPEPELEPEPEPELTYNPLNLNWWRQTEERIPVKLLVIYLETGYIGTHFFYIFFPHLNEMFFIFREIRIEYESNNEYHIFYGSTFLQNGIISIKFHMPTSMLYTTLKFTSIIPIKIRDENVQSILNYFYFVYN